MKEKVVLAYSGGLDTTAIIPWLKENYDYEVICCCVDCGQEEELDGLEERAKYSGASKLYIVEIILCLAYRQALYMKTNICSELPWLVLESQKHWLMSQEKKALLRSATAQPEKEMTRSVLNLVSKLSLRT